MRSTLARVLAGTLVGAAAIFATAPAAFAHGDPSSHSLEQDVLYPAVGDRPTPDTELRLLGLLYAARDAGYPIKVALVANEQDLTDDLSMLSKPQEYAEFVAGEVSRARPLRGPILVVMPMGYGLAGNLPDETGTPHPLTRAQSATLVAGLGAVAGDTGEELAVGAEAATRKLAAIAGHPLPTVVPPAQPLRASAKAADDGAPNLWLALGIFLGVFLFAALAYEAQRRFTASDKPERGEGAAQPLEASSR
jgi:hypothetical protein